VTLNPYSRILSRRIAPAAALLALAAFVAPAGAAAGDALDAVARDLSALEAVYARHRSGGPASAASQAPSPLSLAAARARAADAQAKSQALAQLWGFRVGTAALQAELDRMARTSRDPAFLRELFAALDDDPARLAEALVRPRLVESLIRPRYARDARLHAGTRQRAAQLVESAARSGDFYALPGFHVDTWRLDPHAAADPRESERWLARGVVVLDEERWETRVRQLAVELGVPVRTAAGTPLADLLAQLPLARPTRLVEDDESFEAQVVLGSGGPQLRVGHARFAKTPFEAWWAGARVQFAGDAPAPLSRTASSGDKPLRLPAIGDAGCTDDSWSGPLQVEPRARWKHVAAWTGTEMLVWGGQLSDEASLVLDDGARYDPTTDTWMPMSSEGAPSPRREALSVWTGSELIVWGGRGAGYSALPDGAAYDPALDRWRPIAPTSIPLTSQYGTLNAVWTGTEVLFYLGDTRTGARYRPDLDAWFPIASDGAPQIGQGHTAVWTGSEMIVWGGEIFPQQQGGRYDPVTDTWRPIATDARVYTTNGHTAVWTGTEMIVWGGYLFGTSGGAYDPVADAWRPVHFGEEAWAHTAVWTGSEMLVFGGWWGQCYSTEAGYRYDPVADRATPIASIGSPLSRGYHTAVWTGREMIVWGGEYRFHTDGRTGLSSGGRYDPATNAWTPTRTSGAPLARVDHSATWSGAELIVWGGGRGYFRCGDNEYARKSGGRYEPATNAWLPTAEPASLPARMQHAALWAGDRMVVWGGREVRFAYPTTAPGVAYDPALDAWTDIASDGAPEGRALPAAVWSGTEMLVWGGIGGYGWNDPSFAIDTGGRYDPQLDRWLPIPADGAPSARLDHTATWSGDGMIVWGGTGADGAVTAGGAAYRPDTDAWTPLSETNAPLSCTGHAAAWTGAEMFVAGCVDPPALYDPQLDAWRPASTAGAPAPGCGGQALFTGQEVLHWCAAGGTRYEPASDTWRPISAVASPVATAAQRPVWSGEQMLVWGTATDGADSGAYCAQCAPRPWYADADGDGFGVAGEVTSACRQPSGTTAAAGDCMPLDPAVFPGAAETCNGLDDDCDGLQNEDPEAGLSCPEVSFCTLGSCPGGECAYGPSGACPVTGMVRYYRDSAGHEPAQPFVAEAGVRLALTGSSSGEATTGADGLYDLGPRFQQVTVTPQPRLDAASSPFVSSYDALLAAKSALGWVVLTPLQRRAADVSGDGSVTFFDASLIAQYVVGLIVPVGYPDPDPAHPRRRFPAAAAAGSDWQFAPAQRSAFLAAAAPDPLNFAAILYGEVSGNRAEADALPTSRRPVLQNAPATLEFARPAGATMTLERARTARAPGTSRGTTTVLLKIRPAAGIQALEIAVEPGAGAVGLVAVSGRRELAGFEVLVDARAPGGKAGLYGVVPLAGDEARVELTLSGQPSAAELRRLLRVVANEGLIPLRWEGERAVAEGRHRDPLRTSP
jgi:hypothetical protein